MKIAMASDHGGFALKEQLRQYVESKGHQVADLGCYSPDRADYPDYGVACGEAVAKGEADRGIVVCGTGIGISIAANKVKGVRCALCTDPVMARLCREHNNANMLSLGERIVGIELAKGIVDAFLNTEPEGGRHAERVAKITAYDEAR
ncbi:MAG: ribose 5-phosphate isomerase B [Clostridia bacterium]|nr:ribose 5-phosphate isomerase B [Clostridia bacterium]